MTKISVRVVSMLIALALIACERETDSRELINEVKEADLAFSKMSEEQGMAKAFIEYADESVIKLNNKHYATIGKGDLIKALTSEEFNGKLTWEPLTARADQNLGYTFGDWKMELKMNERDTVLFGNYVTVWRKQKDGQWKFVLDGGNPTPGPTPPTMRERMKRLE